MLFFQEEVHSHSLSPGERELPPGVATVVDLTVETEHSVLRITIVTIGLIGLILLLIYGAWGMMDLTQFDTYTALGISVRWLYLALFVSSGLWVVRTLVTLGRNLRDLFS